MFQYICAFSSSSCPQSFLPLVKQAECVSVCCREIERRKFNRVRKREESEHAMLEFEKDHNDAAATSEAPCFHIMDWYKCILSFNMHMHNKYTDWKYL